MCGIYISGCVCVVDVSTVSVYTVNLYPSFIVQSCHSFMNKSTVPTAHIRGSMSSLLARDSK